MHAGEIKKSKYFLILSLKSTHKYRIISSGKHSQCLFNVKALRGGAH